MLWALMQGALAAPGGTADPAEIARWRDSVVMLVSGPAWCSGVVIDEQGTIATAYHCVAAGRKVGITTRDGQEAVGRTIGASPDEDLALVAAPDLAGKVQPLLIRSEPPLVGERVYGIGHPHAPSALRGGDMEGMLWWSVTEGIVSNVGPKLIQTDAALNPGNSGGPVVDATGRIVGIASRKLMADNIAFLATGDALADLFLDPRPPSWLGGQWAVGFSLAQPLDAYAARSGEVVVSAIVRDRVVLSGAAAAPLGARLMALESGQSSYLAGEATGSLRLRVGRGIWSTSLDAGGGMYALTRLERLDEEDSSYVFASPAEFAPGVAVRLGFGGTALRGVGLIQEGELGMLLLMVDLDVPGVVGTF